MTQCTIVVTSSWRMKLPWLDATGISSAATWIYDLNRARMTYPSSLPFFANIERDPTRQNHAQSTLKGQNHCLCAEKGARNMQRNTHVVVLRELFMKLASWSQTFFRGGLELHRQHLNSAAAALRSVQSLEDLQSTMWSSNIFQLFHVFAQSYRLRRNFAASYWICCLDCWFVGKPES